MEKIFSLIWKTQAEKTKLKQGYLSIDDCIIKLQMFAKISAPFEMTGDVGGSLWSVGFVDDDLLLPKDLCWTTDQNLNLNLALILVLKSIAIKELNLSRPFHDRERIAPRLFILSKMPKINTWLDAHFPFFQEFETATYLNFQNHNPAEKTGLWSYWKNQISSRSLDIDSDEEKKMSELIQRQKRNDIPPDFLHATTPLPYRKINLQVSPQNTSLIQKKSDEIQTQKKRNQKEYTENADQNKKESVNPILHSFEKMETADDYDGGQRITSGDDELEAHQNALDELELNRHTSAGQASSLYKQDSSQFKIQPHSQETSELSKNCQYPEWNYKENKYLKSFCTVYPETPEELMSGLEYKNDILSKEQSLILKWKMKLNSVVNIPKWKNRLIEGPEIDLDSAIRLLPELKQFSGRPRLYSQKIKSENDVSILILADVSYSTDTWINGQKVIEIIKKSLSITSFIFEDIFDQVSVAITSSETRKRIYYQELKKFDEDWIHFFKRSYKITPQQYTRLGPAIRHACHLLTAQNAKKPILILITDGKPTDLDPYEGHYGQHDVRKAVDEAKHSGIHVLTLAISDFDPVSLKKTFDRPCSVKNADDFCREMSQFIWSLCLKNR